MLDLDAVRMQCDREERKLWQIEKLEEFCTTGLSTAEVGAIVAVLVLLCIVIVLLVLWTCYRWQRWRLVMQ